MLHARIPESLDEAIRSAASELGMSVSNLVRNVLANALEVVEVATMHMPARAAAAAAAMRKEARSTGSRADSEPAASAASPASVAPAAPAGPAVVLGWQEATLNLNAVCDRCNAILPRGSRASISIPEPASAPRVVRCLPCLEELTRDAVDTH